MVAALSDLARRREQVRAKQLTPAEIATHRTMVFDREPILRKVEDSIDSSAHEARNRILSEPLERRIPRLGPRNIGEGIAAGMVEAAVAVGIEDLFGVPFGATSDTINVKSVEGGKVYTVNVNAPVQNMAKARGFLDSTTGFTSILTDKFEVSNVEVLNERILRDTYQVEVLVED